MTAERLDEQWQAPRTAVAVPYARHEVRHLAEKALGYGDRTDDVELAASELLTNAVDHGGGTQMSIRVRADEHLIRVEVQDAGGSASPRIPEAAAGDHGRGLFIVAAVASRWCAVRTADGSSVVWFEIDR